MNRCERGLSLVSPVLFGVLVLALTARGQDESTRLAQLLETKAPSIVTIRAVLKMEFGGHGQEIRQEVKGCVVDAGGLIMVPNEPLSPSGDDNMKITPIDLKVVVGNEDKEYAAVLVAKDTKVDLAFLQIQGLEDRRLEAVSFAEAGTPSIGQSVVAVSRLDKGYDYAPLFLVTRVNGRILKPRKVWAMEQPGDAALPLFDLDGRVMGVTSALESTESDGDANPFAMLMGGRNRSRRVLLPAKVVAGLIEQARKRVAEGTGEGSAEIKAEGGDAEKKSEAPVEGGTGEKKGS